MNAIGYLRVSTDGQVGEDKFGLDSQKEQIEKYAKDNDIEIVEWFIDEGISGVTESRPAFDRILYGDITNPPYQFVIVAKNDRIARDINVYFYYKMMLHKKDIKLISVSEDFGQFGVFSSILEAFTLCVAQMERDNITKRTSMGRNVKSERGGYSGGKAPYGYSSERGSGKLVINESEVPLIKRIFEIRDNGGTMKDIVQTLKDEGYKTRKENDFQISTIQYILGNRKTYEGYYKYGENGDWVKGMHEPILQEKE